MGFNTTVLVLNDCLVDIEHDVGFGQKVSQAINRVTLGDPVDIPSGRSGNAAMVVETHHAGGFKIIAVGGNTAYDLGYAGSTMDFDPRRNEDLKAMLNILLENRGMKVIATGSRKEVRAQSCGKAKEDQ